MYHLVVDAQGAGSGLAALLTQGGEETVLLADGAHMSAIERQDLVLHTGHGSFATPVEVWTGAQTARPPQVILLCGPGDAFGEFWREIWEITQKTAPIVVLL